MPAKPKKEKLRCKYFTWLIGPRNGVWSADGRSNRPNPGRHSLATRSYEEAKRNLVQLDIGRAVELGLADRAELDNDDALSPLLSLDEGVKVYLTHVQRTLVTGGASRKTAQRYRAVFEKAVPFFRNLGFTTWNEIGRSQLESYSEWLVSENYAYRTEFLELTTIKQAFNFWTDPEVAYLPIDRRIRMPLTKPSGTDTHCWRPEEVRAIVDYCRRESSLNWFADVFVGLVCTGLRISELAQLRWSDVNLSVGMISLRDETYSRPRAARRSRTTKSRRGRSFPVHDELRSILERMQRAKNSGLVFRGPHGAAIRPDATRLVLVNKVLQPLAAQFPSDGEIGFVDGRLHSCRHYFCSACANDGVPEQIVMRWLGHQASDMVRHYYHLSDKVAQSQMRKVQFNSGAS